jgi:phosphoglycolate phosphatase-like HAD superfamily hydrolase
MFDIDGTLLNCTDAVHYFAFCEALSGVAGRPLNLDGVVAHGNVDVGILRDAFRAGGVPEDMWRPRVQELQAGMCRFVEARQEDLRLTVLPGVRDVLLHLRARGAVLGVATGNLERIGWLKLESAGIRDLFDFGGFSDAYEYRRDVFGGALRKAKELAGDEARICVVGDTPEDIRAARAHGLDVIAVATGVYRAEELEAEGPTLCLSALAELLPTPEHAVQVRTAPLSS